MVTQANPETAYSIAAAAVCLLNLCLQPCRRHRRSRALANNLRPTAHPCRKQKRLLSPYGVQIQGPLATTRTVSKGTQVSQCAYHNVRQERYSFNAFALLAGHLDHTRHHAAHTTKTSHSSHSTQTSFAALRTCRNRFIQQLNEFLLVLADQCIQLWILLQ